MNIAEIARFVNGKVVVDKAGAEINYAYTGDLLSDVMAHCGEESVLITVQNHLNTIAVCTLNGIEAIVMCHGRAVPDDMKAAAEREEVGIIVTEMSQFAATKALAALDASEKGKV